MSIYSTMWEIMVPRRHWFDSEFVKVFAQAVPPHIGHPSHYPEGDPYADFLPPVVQDYDPESGEERVQRAVVILQEGRDKKEVQRYIDPLIVMSGEEYLRVGFQELLDRIHKAIGWDETVIGVAVLPNGQTKVIRTSDRRDR